MADQTIGSLTAAEEVRNTDLLVMEQDGTAKSLSGQVLVSSLLSFIDGHGGVVDVQQTESGTAGNGRMHTVTFICADGTRYNLQVQDGYKGDTGTAAHIYIKYSDSEPTQDSDMVEVPSNWIGIYSGTATSAPTAYTSYDWFEIKGDIGEPSELLNSTVVYQVGSTGTVIPNGAWSSNVPIVPAGYYLWSRTTFRFNTGNPVDVYASTRQGIDGEGAPTSDPPLMSYGRDGVVGTATSFARADHRHPSPVYCHYEAAITNMRTSITDNNVTDNMRIIGIEFGNPSVITSDVAWATYAGRFDLAATMKAESSTDAFIYFAVAPDGIE